jgi:hypothetical protein
MPMSLHAVFWPRTVGPVPVLCASVVPTGSPARSRPAPVWDSLMIRNKRALDGGDRSRPASSAARNATALSGVIVSSDPSR